MIRLTEDQGRDLVASLQHLLDGQRERGLGPAFMQAMIDQIEQQLAQPTYATDLIDAIRTAVMGRLNRNILSGATLTALQTVLLSPREMQMALVTKKQLTCMGCGSQLVHDELTVVSGTDVVCGRCRYPTLVRCNSCGDATGVGPKLKRALDIIKKECQCHMPLKKNKKIEIDPPALNIGEYGVPAANEPIWYADQNMPARPVVRQEGEAVRIPRRGAWVQQNRDQIAAGYRGMGTPAPLDPPVNDDDVEEDEVNE